MPDQLKKITTVVADTGDIDSIARYKPTGATTNPSLLLKAAQVPQSNHLVRAAVDYAMGRSDDRQTRALDMMDRLAVDFAVEILKIIPGRISTEVDARLCVNTDSSIARAEKIIGMYQHAGIAKGRILIKIASTWEGLRNFTIDTLKLEDYVCELCDQHA